LLGYFKIFPNFFAEYFQQLSTQPLLSKLLSFLSSKQTQFFFINADEELKLVVFNDNNEIVEDLIRQVVMISDFAL